MNAIQKLLTEHMAIWTAADTEKKSGRGRASGNAGSVYGIKKLRELILELGVRGKLLPQDANDEPASELLKRIQAEKVKLVAEGKIKKDKPLVPIGEDEKPFELPHGWEWVRIGSICHDWGQKTPDNEFTYIEVSAIDSQRGLISSPELVSPENAPSRARKIVKKGTVIYSTIRPYLLNIAVIEDDFLPEPIASTAFAIVHPFCLMPPRYFLSYFRSPVFVRYVESVQMGIAYPAINDGQFFSGLIALPPHAEQHRIVAKVDELMALCDQLEAQHSNAVEAHEKLVSHLLGTLTQSQSADDFGTNWQRIAAHFNTLFTTEASIDLLKQTLLQLAVMGKLVPQDPNDEPASELLKRIQAEKAKLVAEGKLKNEKTLSPISKEEKPFELPNKWEWVRFGDALINRDAERIPISSDIRQTRKGDYDYYGASGIIDKIDQYLFDKPLLLIGEDGANLINRSTPIAFIARGKYWVNNHAHVLDGLNEKFLRYVELYINAIDLKSYVTGTAQPKMNQAKMNSILLGLPPESEQHRIVAKVDELMSLCDQLKIRIQQASQKQQLIADALVGQATA